MSIERDANKTSGFQSKDRVIRVFISSTFRDMQEERDYLVKFVFPELRKMCELRGVTWGEVDLRWGVTTEQAAEGKVLPICLEEIRRCRPYFIGLLGERYGWVPEIIPQQVIDGEPWLKEHVHEKKSVTELEILHGVLRNPDMAQHAFFYFRDPAYVNSVPEDKKGDFTTPSTGSGSAENTEKLRELKDRIRASGFPVRENYPDPKALGELVKQDLIKVIDQLYPPDVKLDPLDHEALDHEAYSQSRVRVYIGRQVYFDRLDAHADGGGDQPLVILGESGSGKSALLANWVVRYRQAHPDVLILQHFIGASPQSADWAAMLRRIMGEFKRKLGIEQNIPDNPDDLRSAFPDWLHVAAVKGRVVLVLDALDELEDRNGAPDLVWLPPVMPENVRLILSTLPGRPLDNLKKRRWPMFEVSLLDAEERKRLVVGYLGQYSKNLGVERVERIAAADITANPLYLRALLNELRVFGVYERLDEWIGHYLEAKTIPALYEKILERYEVDYDPAERPGMVRDTFMLLWAARRGLSEAELLELLGADGQPLPRASWAPLYLAADQCLVNRSGLIGFAHNYFRETIRLKFLPSEQEQDVLHVRLADHFAVRNAGPRKIEELPWQLAQAKAWQRLYELLSDLDFLNAAATAHFNDLRVYWGQVEANSEFRMLDAYRPVLDSPPEHAESSATQVFVLLMTIRPGEQLLSFSEGMVQHYREKGDRESLAVWLSNLSTVLYGRGEMGRVFDLNTEREDVCRELSDLSGVAEAFVRQAQCAEWLSDEKAALRLYDRAERICRELTDRSGLASVLCSKAMVLAKQGDFEAAWKLLEEQEQICREWGTQTGLAACLINQGHILSFLHRPQDALAVLDEAERITRELGHEIRLPVFRNRAAAHLAHAMYLVDHDQPAEALRWAMEAYRLAIAHGLEDTAKAAGAVLDLVRMRAG